MSTAVSLSNNPFEDSFHPNAKPRGLNPFEEDNGRKDPTNTRANIHARTTATASSGSGSGHNMNPFDEQGVDVEVFMGQGARGGGVITDDGPHHHDLLMQGHTPAEASWQYLGDLPYRRVPIYSNVQWHQPPAPPAPQKPSQQQKGKKEQDVSTSSYYANSSRHAGLATFPPFLLKQHHLPKMNPREIRQLLASTTTTKVAGCPHGGPIAVVTLPVAVKGGSSSSGTTITAATTSTSSSATSGTSSTGTLHQQTTEIKILTNSGKLLSRIVFPPPFLERTGRIYTPSDILTLGFTSRTLLLVILKDSVLLVYNVRGELVLHPFLILPKDSSSNPSPSSSSAAAGGSAGGAASSSSGSSSLLGQELLQASVFEGGVAVLTKNKNCALVELFDEHDQQDDSVGGITMQEYLQGAHKSARRITNVNANDSMFLLDHQNATTSNTNMVLVEMTPSPSSAGHFALVTPLPTAAYASRNFWSYCALAVLPRSRTLSKHPEVFVSTSDHSVVVVDVTTCELTDVNCRARIASPIVQMCFAPNGRFLACFTEAQMLTVISTSFETKVLDFDTSEGSNCPPLDICWCGEDSVVLHWKKLGVLMVGPYGDWLRFPYEGVEEVHLIPEMDCCRVITDTSVELLQRVPPATALLLRIGSIETSAMLLDAADAFYSGGIGSGSNGGDSSGAPTCDDSVRAIVKTGLLQEAIETCTDSACREFDIVTQKRLLRAASYGMHFSYKNAQDEKRLVMGGPVTGSDPESGLLPSPTTVKFVNVSRKLRVLNALRNPNVGFVLTSAQFDAITPAGVVARLVANFKRPALAAAIAKYLGLPKSVQLFARASKAAALVEMATDTGHSDSEIAEAAIRIINEDDGKAAAASAAAASILTHRGGYATVALTASKAGRKGVANLLLMLESSVADKVPALISTGSYADAIAVATTARDADFIFSTLMEYKKVCMSSATAADVSKAQATYHSTVISKFTPEAFNMLRRYLGTTADVKSVTNLLLRAQKFTDAGSAMALRAVGESDFREKQGILAEASRVFGLGKETALFKSCTDDYLELLKDQEVVRTKYGSNEVAPEESSVTGTISALLKFAASNIREQHRLLSDADKIAKKFRVSEKRLWHIKVKAFADSGQWSNLRILADSKKSPIGYKPFARVTIRGKQSTEEVMRYIERVTVPEEKYDLFCEAGFWKNALEEAGRMRDVRRILNVKTLCNSPELQLQAEQMMARLA